MAHRRCSLSIYRSIYLSITRTHTQEHMSAAQMETYQELMMKAVDAHHKRKADKAAKAAALAKAPPGKYREANPDRAIYRASLVQFYSKYKLELTLNDALHNFMDKVEYAYRYVPSCGW
jgi:hypothetical protein